MLTSDNVRYLPLDKLLISFLLGEREIADLSRAILLVSPIWF